MSDHQPNEPTVPLAVPGEFETVGPEPGRRGTRRGAVITAVAVAVAAALGGGAYAAYSFLAGGGPQPAEVLPASTVAVLSVDLDPSASQKIAAIKSIRRFPSLKESLGLHADDDLREYVFDKITGAGHCKLDFDKDVKPWLGKRAAFAGVDLGGSRPSPVIALQISDPVKAKAGFRAIVDCTDPADLSYVVGDDYLIASDSAAHAKAVLDGGRDRPLADDAAYRKWTGEVGDAGVLSFYVGKRAAQYGDQLFDQLSGDVSGGILGGTADNGDQSLADGDAGGPTDPLAPIRDALKDFRGLGGTVRFAGGGMELSIAGGGLDQLADLATVGKEVGELPSDTAFALGFGVPDDYAEKTLDRLGDGGDVATDIEKHTGLDLPEDLQTLLGEAVIVSLGGDAPASLEDVRAIDDVPAGVVIHGDAQRIKDIIATAEDHLGMHLSDIPLVVEGSGDKVAIGTSKGYAEELLRGGDLGSQDRFRDAVPDAERAAGILFVDFDSGWGSTVADLVAGDEGQTSGEEVRGDVAPLRAAGFSSWEDGDVSHALLKITTN
jgi:hypothetical protein